MRWRRALSWVALAIAALIGGCSVLLNQLFPADLCATEVFTKVRSPSGKLTAIVYEIDCGATTGFSRQVVIVPTTERRIDPQALPRGFFAISLGSAVDDHLAMRDGLVDLHWLADDHLDIAYPAGSRPIRSAARSDGVDMTYRTYLNAPDGAKP
ncbi:hypothetical protein [Roseateles sp. P5_E1]